MTCIVGLKTKQGVLLGADSALDFGAHTALVDDKLFQCAGMWCGAAGDALAIQYLKNTMPMVPKRLKDPLAWAAKVMSPRLLELRESLQHVSEDVHLEAILVHRDTMFLVTLRGEVIQLLSEYVCVGSGAEYAMGALHNLKGSPEDRVTKAITTAAHFAPGSVQPPVRLQWVK